MPSQPRIKGPPSAEQHIRNTTLFAFDGHYAIRQQPFHGVAHDGPICIIIRIRQQIVFVLIKAAEKSGIESFPHSRAVHRREPLDRSRNCSSLFIPFPGFFDPETALFIFPAAAAWAGIVTPRLFHINAS